MSHPDPEIGKSIADEVVKMLRSVAPHWRDEQFDLIHSVVSLTVNFRSAESIMASVRLNLEATEAKTEELIGAYRYGV